MFLHLSFDIEEDAPVPSTFSTALLATFAQRDQVMYVRGNGGRIFLEVEEWNDATEGNRRTVAASSERFEGHRRAHGAIVRCSGGADAVMSEHAGRKADCRRAAAMSDAE